MAVLMNSAVNTIAMVSTITAQSNGFNPNHRPTMITEVANREWIQALCWVFSTYHQPRKACPNAAMRELTNVLSDIILLESGFFQARDVPKSRLVLSTCGPFLQRPHGHARANARRRERPKVALPIRVDDPRCLPVPVREGWRSGYHRYNARLFPGPFRRRERKAHRLASRLPDNSDSIHAGVCCPSIQSIVRNLKIETHAQARHLRHV